MLASIFSCLSQAKALVHVYIQLQTTSEGLVLHGQRIKLTSLKIAPIYCTQLGKKVPMANFVLQNINCLGMVLTWLFLIEDSEITLFENWEQFICLAHEELLKAYMNTYKQIAPSIVDLIYPLIQISRKLFAIPLQLCKY